MLSQEEVLYQLLERTGLKPQDLTNIRENVHDEKSIVNMKYLFISSIDLIRELNSKIENITLANRSFIMNMTNVTNDQDDIINAMLEDLTNEGTL